MIIGVDLDDVLMDFNTGLCTFHNARYGTSLVRENLISYALEETWGCDREEAVRRVREFYHSSEHFTTQPILGAVEVIRELQDAGRTIAVITSRPESISIQTYSWLERHFPSLVGNVHFASHFFHQETKITKVEICQKLGIEIFIDDAPFHVESVATVVGQVLLFDAPWNRGCDFTLPNIQRVDSWDEIRILLRGSAQV